MFIPLSKPSHVRKKNKVTQVNLRSIMHTKLFGNIKNIDPKSMKRITRNNNFSLHVINEKYKLPKKILNRSLLNKSSQISNLRVKNISNYRHNNKSVCKLNTEVISDYEAPIISIYSPLKNSLHFKYNNIFIDEKGKGHKQIISYIPHSSNRLISSMNNKMKMLFSLSTKNDYEPVDQLGLQKAGNLDIELTNHLNQKVNVNSVKRLISENKIALLKSNLESRYKSNKKNKFKNLINGIQTKINFKFSFPKVYQSRYKSIKIPSLVTNTKKAEKERIINPDWGPW